jgi:DNA polymerase-4
MGPDFIASLSVAKFHGVGPVTAAKMQRLGIQTGADLRAKWLAFLQQRFGKSATWYHNVANGDDERPVVADRPRKSSGSENTFERDLTSPAEVEAGAEAMADDVWSCCERAGAFGRTVTVKVKFADARPFRRQCGDLCRIRSEEKIADSQTPPASNRSLCQVVRPIV